MRTAEVDDSHFVSLDSTRVLSAGRGVAFNEDDEMRDLGRR